MRPAPSPAPSPAERTGDRPNRAAARAQAARARKAQARRAALEALEPRALLATIPAPVADPDIPVDVTGMDSLRTISGGDVYDSAPTIAVDRYNPSKLAATWVTHNPAAQFPAVTAHAAYSADGGKTWTNISGSLPSVRFDPSSGNNPHLYNAVSQPSVAFDGKDNFYVLEIQHSDDFATGQVFLQPFDFSGAAPVARPTTQFPTWFKGGDPNVFPNPQTAIRDASLAVDDNLPGFTDPATGQVQADPGANNVYIAWETDTDVPSGYNGPWDPNTVQLSYSANAGATFTLVKQTGAPDDPLGRTYVDQYQLGGSHFQGIEHDAAPRLAISQGTAAAPGGTARVAGGQVTVLYDDFTGGRQPGASPPVDILRAARVTYNPSSTNFEFVGRNTVASTVVQGAVNAPYPGVTTVGPQGVGPGGSIASDNALGSYDPNSGRLYVAYVDRFEGIRFPDKGGSNPADNTDIFVSVSDDGGLSWRSLKTDAFGRKDKVNDDAAFSDGFSGAIDVPGQTTGRAQFQPLVAVDPATGTLALTYEDTRYDPARTRPVESVQLSIDGGSTFSPSTYADQAQVANDQALRRDLTLGPIAANQAAQPDAGVGAIVGLGDHQGLAIYGGKLWVAFASNVNGGTDTNTKTHIHVAPMVYAAGPRVIASTMGVVSARTVTDAVTGLPVTFNNKVVTDPTQGVPGTPIADGFLVTFDRPVDPTTFTAADVRVTFRDPFTTGNSPGIPVAITSDPVPVSGPGVAPNTFLVRFAGQANVGTYSYQIGPDIRDTSRNTLATNTYYAPQTAGNLPAISPAANDVTSTLAISGVPANQGIYDLKVLVSLQYPTDGDLTLQLIPPPGYLPNGQTSITLVARRGGAGSDFTDTVFDEEARLPINSGSAPFSGRFRTDAFVKGTASGLHLLDGKGPNGTWKLEILSNGVSAGKLLSWGMQVSTSNRSFDGNFTQAGTAALSPAGAGLSPGALMDQDASGVGGRNPNAGGPGAPGSVVFGTAPGDVYAVPTPNPTTPEVFNGQNINPPFAATTLPLQIAGPHVVRTFVPNAATRTADNLVTDAPVSALTIVFDRDMDPNSLTIGTHVARFSTPYGTFAPGDRLPDGSTLAVQIVAAPNSDPQNPNSDPDPSHPRTYQVQFFKVQPGSTSAVAFPQTLSGTYSVALTSDVQSEGGYPIDVNQNAGLDFLRGIPSAGTLAQSYTSQAPVPIGPGPAGTEFISTVNVPDNFSVKGVTVKLNIDFPQDKLLTVVLRGPDNFPVTLFSGVGNVGTGANFTNTVLDDAASTPIANGGPPFFGTFNPQQALADFNNHNSQGTWKLVVTVAADESDAVGQIKDFTITLKQPLSNSGLGETVADQATANFRIFTFDPTNPLAANTWTAIGPNGEGAKAPGGNAEVAGRVSAMAVDPSDSSGNTVYVAGASGGIWKTTNFLTKDPAGPTYHPLLDQAVSNFGLDIGSIAIFPRNNDPNQSIIFAATGDASAAGDPAIRGQAQTQRGIGFLRSMDGGATWTLLDSRDNTISATVRDRFFASLPGTAGVTAYKIAVDPHLTLSGQVIVYAALSDIDGGGNLVTSGGKGGIWKSLDSGQTWQLMRGGEATDLTLDYNSVNPDSQNLDFLYAAFRGDGVYFSPNGAQNFDLMTGNVGDPLIQDVDPASPQPVSVFRAPPATTPNGKPGRIVLAKPARRVNPDGSNADPLYNLITQGWLYAAVVNFTGGDLVENGGSNFLGLYMTKDFGQTWTPVQFNSANGLPTNNTAPADEPISGSGTIAGGAFTLGNFALSLAVDANDPNVVYLGGTDEYRATGLLRIDTTGIHDAHSFYADSQTVGGSLRSNAADSAVGLLSATNGIYGTNPPSLDPFAQPILSLIHNPADPFNADSTILVHNLKNVASGGIGFPNDGAHTKWTRFDQALAPNPYADPASDPWAIPTRDVHQILTSIDPLTGATRFLFATDQGVYTAVAGPNGQLIGSLGDTANTRVGTNTASGDVKIVNGSRNGNLAIAQMYQGAAQPSQLAADLSVLRGFFYGTTQDVGIAQSDPNIIAKGTASYGNLSYNIDTINGPNEAIVGPGGTIDRGTAVGLATQQTLKTGDAGAVYDYRVSEDLIGLDGRPSTDTVQVNTVGKTFGLYQTDLPGGTPDPQFPLRPGMYLTVNPLSADQMLISSVAGRVFATTTRGTIWSEIGNPSALDGTQAQALAYGAPDPSPPGGGLGALNNYIFAGTKAGNIYVTFTAGGGSGNQWTKLSGGLDGSPVKMIVTDPTRGSHRAYALTERGVYSMADALAGGSWRKITGNLDVAGSLPTAGRLTSIQADWRYLIPDDFTNPAGPTHPMLYLGSDAGVYRSTDQGTTWKLFPDGAAGITGSAGGIGLLNSPLGDGGGLPHASVTDLDLSLGNIDPTTGRPNVTTGPNTLMASTFGRGAYAIRLAPVVFPNMSGNSAILHLSAAAPTPPGTSDSGFSNTDATTNVTQPVIEGLSEQTAFGNAVHVALYDVSDTSIFTRDAIGAILAGLPTLPDGTPTPQPKLIPVVAGTDVTDSAGRFAVQVAPGYFLADGSTDGAKRILVQATNGSGTKGNFAPLGQLLFSQFDVTGSDELADPTAYSFILDTTPPVAPGAPDLTDASDKGLSHTDNITNVSTNLAFTVALSTGEPSTTHVYLVRDSDSNIVAESSGTAAPGSITLVDPGPVDDGTHFYWAYEVDQAGNQGPISDKLKVVIDTVRPSRPGVPKLDPNNPAGGSDSGLVGDNITNVNNPYLTGTGEPGGQMQIIDAVGNVLGPIPSTQSPNVDAKGAYSVQAGNVDTNDPTKILPLSDGTYSLRVQEMDVAGNVSDPSAPLSVTIQTRKPSTPTLQLVAADDSGTVGDNITNVNQPRLTGKGTPGLSVKLVLVSGTITDASGKVLVAPGGTIAPTGPTPIIVAADGTYLIKFPTPLPDGTYVVKSVVSDVAGNASESAPLQLQILGGGFGNGGGGGGGTVPGQPTLTLNPADDTGIKGDNVTVVRRPRLIGIARDEQGNPLPNAQLDLVGLFPSGPAVIALANASATGLFTFNLPNDLVDGTLTVQARIRDVAGNPHTPSAPVTLRIVSVPGDTNADGTTDLDSFSPSTSTFTFRVPAGTTTTSAPFASAPGDIPVQGDWDADGKTDFGFFRPSTGQYFVQFSRGSSAIIPFGQPGDLPVPADYDGDLVTDFAVFRPSTGAWIIFRSQTAVVDTVYLGQPGDIPLPYDFDGDHRTDYAVYRPSTSQFFVAPTSGLKSGFNNALSANEISTIPNVAFGQPNISVPIIADYDGDGKADIAVYQTTTGHWFTWTSSGKPAALVYGVPGLDIPVPADYDGDGKADFALYRPSTTEWQILGSSFGAHIFASGSVGDMPLLAPLAYRANLLASTRTVGGASGADTEATSPSVVTIAPPASPPSGSSTILAAPSGSGGGALTDSAPSKSSAPVAPVPIRRRPAQGHPATKAGHPAHKATSNHPHDAAINHLGRFKLIRRRNGH